MDAADASSQADHAYRLLRREILHGALMPGEWLRAATLRAQYQLGLTPIREALFRLSSEGLVANENNRGCRVTSASRAELADLMATRRDIERLCLVQAIAVGDTGWEAEIVAALHVLSRTALPHHDTDAAGAEAWEMQHRRFHHALVSACPSAWLRRFWGTLADHSERYRKIRLLHHRQADALVRDVAREHQAIAEAVLARDADTAVALMDTHLRDTEQGVAPFLRFTDLEETER